MAKKKKEIWLPYTPPQPPIQPTALFKKCCYQRLLRPGDPQYDNQGNVIVPKWKQQLEESHPDRYQWRYYD